MKKRMLSLLLCLCMAVTLLPGTALAAEESKIFGTCGDGLVWDYNATTNKLLIQRTEETGTFAMDDYTVYIPAPWDHLKENIKTIDIGKDVTHIGDCAFSGCKALTTVTFNGENQQSALKSIGDYAFSGCDKLEQVTIPHNVEEIGVGPFANCKKLLSITIEDVEGARYYTEDGILYDSGAPYGSTEKTLVQCPAGKSGIVDVANQGVEVIGESAFSWCEKIEGVVLPEALQRIEDLAFRWCTNLKSCRISGNAANLQTIGAEAFSGCKSLLSMDLSDATTLSSIGNSAFSTCTQLETLRLPQNLTTIGTSAFSSCRALKSIELPSGVTDIPMSAFSSCTGLTNITFHDGIKSIGNSAFNNAGLTRLTIPATVETVVDAFNSCQSLEEVNIQCRLTEIGGTMFSYCKGLKTLHLPDSVTSISVHAFLRAESLKDVYYAGTKAQWQAITIGEVPDNDHDLAADAAFDSKDCLSRATIHCADGDILPSSGTTEPDNPNPDNPNPDVPDTPATSGSCGENTVWSLSKDGVLTISGSGPMAELTSGQSYGWASQSAKIKQVVIESGVTTVGDGAFAGCAKLTSVTIPGSVATIGAAAFQGCTGLTSVTIPEGVETLYDAVFFGCTKLTQVSLPKSLTAIRHDVFSNTSLKTVVYAGSESEWNTIEISKTEGSDPFLGVEIQYNSSGSTPQPVTETFTASRNHFNPPGGVTVLTYKNTDPAAFAAKKDKITLTCSVHHYDAVGESENFPVGEPVIGTDTLVWTVTIPENTIDYAVDYTFDCMIHDDGNNTDNPFGQIIVSVVAKTASIYVPVESVAVSPKTASVDVGNMVALRAAVLPIDVSEYSGEWTSSNESVATVSEEGVVTGVSAGTAIITYSASTSDGALVTKSDACTVTVNSGSGGGSHGGSSSGGSSSNTTSTTTKNPDGSTTTKTENKTTGAVTETTRNPDGSQTKVETRKDGTVTTTETDKAGNKTETVEKPDGSTVITVTQKDGTETTVSTDASGRTEAEVALPKAAVSQAQQGGEAVTLPIPEVRATKDTGTAPAVTVNTGSSQPVKVEIPTASVTPGTVAVIVRADGSEEVVKTSVPTENGVAVELPDGATVKIVDNSKTFADVPAGSWAADAVSFSSARELFGGTSETTFTPDAPMTRAMMVTVLARFDGEDTSGGGTWYQKGVDWAVARGVSNGSDPNGSVTREQLATMLWRYSGSPASNGTLEGFTDASQVSDYAQEAMRWAVENGIINGYGNGQLGPQGNATRAQVAQMLKNFIEK